MLEKNCQSILLFLSSLSFFLLLSFGCFNDFGHEKTENKPILFSGFHDFA
jgi:hypothetical protein